MLDAPGRDRASEYSGPRRVSVPPGRRGRRDLPEDFADDGYDDDFEPVERRSGLRVRFRGLPKTRAGRIFGGVLLLVVIGLAVGVYMMARSFLLHDERFIIPSSSSIEFVGNRNVTRGQLLSVFGEDVERNIFRVPLSDRRTELEQIPWVEHATVMRLLPNRLRISITERTPVAFVRQGSRIGLVDANGVLLEMPMGEKPDVHYSFPVVTGITAQDPASTRAARMKIYQRFTTELDSSGEKVSEQLSEVDLSNPEDVKALIPDHTMDILVHFGDTDFLDRYRRFEQHLPEWRTVYPKLSSVDMRYERQVVLEMQPGAQAPTPSPAGTQSATPPPTEAKSESAKPAVKKPVARTPAAKPASGTKAAAARTPAHAAPAKATHPPAKKPKVATPPPHHAATGPQYYPPQVVHP